MNASEIADRNKILMQELANGSQTARDELIIINRPLVTMTVQRMLQLFVDCRQAKADLVGVGIIALVQAVDRLAELAEYNRPICNYLITAIRSKINTEIKRQRSYYCRHIHVSSYNRLPEDALAVNGEVFDHDDLIKILHNLCVGEDERKIIDLYLENTSVDDITDIIGWPRRAIYKFFQRIGEKIREEWRE